MLLCFLGLLKHVCVNRIWHNISSTLSVRISMLWHTLSLCRTRLTQRSQRIHQFVLEPLGCLAYTELADVQVMHLKPDRKVVVYYMFDLPRGERAPYNYATRSMLLPETKAVIGVQAHGARATVLGDRSPATRLPPKISQPKF